MSVLLQSFSLVALAEIGDKTQLLSIMLAARFGRFWPIIGGILVATLLNHGIVAWAGSSLGHWLQREWLELGAALLFIILGFWILIPDNAPEEKSASASNAFVASLVAFFMAEMGDKTQIATLTLGAEYDDVLIVTIGTTLGMLTANVPAVFFGQQLLEKLPLKLIRYITCALFISYGLWGIGRYFYP